MKFHAVFSFSLHHMDITPLFEKDVPLFLSSIRHRRCSQNEPHPTNLYSSSIWYCVTKSWFLNEMDILIFGMAKSGLGEMLKIVSTLIIKAVIPKTTVQGKWVMHLRGTMQGICAVYIESHGYMHSSSQMKKRRRRKERSKRLLRWNNQNCEKCLHKHSITDYLRNELIANLLWLLLFGWL